MVLVRSGLGSLSGDCRKGWSTRDGDMYEGGYMSLTRKRAKKPASRIRENYRHFNTKCEKSQWMESLFLGQLKADEILVKGVKKE